MEELKSRMVAVERQVSQNTTDIATLDAKLELYAETRYVDGLLRPLESAVVEVREALRHMVKGQEVLAKNQETLAKGQETLNTTYNQLLLDRGQRENEEHKKKIAILEAQLESAKKSAGFTIFVKDKLYPVLAALVAAAAVIGLILAAIKYYVLNDPKP